MPDDRSLSIVNLLYELSVAARGARTAPDRRYISVAYQGIQSFEPQLRELNVEFEVLGNDELRINLRDLSFPVFRTEEEFRVEARLQSFNVEIGIVDFLEKGPIVRTSAGEILPRGVSDEWFFQNVRCYLLLLERLQNLPEIVAYHDTVRRQFVVLSPEHGRLHLGYPPEVPLFLAPTNLDVSTKQFFGLVDNAVSLEVRTIFREEAFPLLAYHHPIADRVPELARKLDIVLESTLREYDVFVRKISFSALKSEFREEREKYFTTLRDVTKNLSTQVIGIPISVTAATVALYNIRSSPALVVTIAVVFEIYSLYLLNVLNLVGSENRQLRSDLSNDTSSIAAKSPRVGASLSLDVERVEFRVRALGRLLYFVMGGVIIVAAGIVVFAGKLLGFTGGLIALLTFVSIVLHLFVLQTTLEPPRHTV